MGNPRYKDRNTKSCVCSIVLFFIIWDTFKGFLKLFNHAYCPLGRICNPPALSISICNATRYIHIHCFSYCYCNIKIPSWQDVSQVVLVPLLKWYAILYFHRLHDLICFDRRYWWGKDKQLFCMLHPFIHLFFTRFLQGDISKRKLP